MIWKQPRNVWQWLLLFSPAILAILASQMAKWWLPPVPPLHLADGREFTNIALHLNRVIGVALKVILAGSFVLALVLSRGEQLAQRFVNALFILLCLAFANSFVAFTGCFFAGTSNPTPQEIVPLDQPSPTAR